MKLILNKKALKNLSKDSQVLPDDVTPQIGGGMTAAATCPATAPETQCQCGGSDYGCGGGGGGGGGDNGTYLCGLPTYDTCMYSIDLC